MSLHTKKAIRRLVSRQTNKKKGTKEILNIWSEKI